MSGDNAARTEKLARAITAPGRATAPLFIISGLACPLAGYLSQRQCSGRGHAAGEDRDGETEPHDGRKLPTQAAACHSSFRLIIPDDAGSLREISAELAQLGYVNSVGQPFSVSSVKGMIAG